jgi:putative hydrolase of the HAD superfamily
MIRKSKNIPQSILSNPKAVIFDTDNTLYPYDPAHREASLAVERKIEEMLGISQKDYRAAFNSAKAEIKKRLGEVASSHSRLLYMQATIEKLNLGTRILLTLDLEQTYWRTFLNSARLFPNTLSFILHLKSKGIITANITDLTAQIQFRKLVYFGLDELFDYVVTSEEAGADKPNKKPFELALKKLKVAPEEAWMIGDNPITDMAGAGKMGIIKIQKKHAGVKIINSGITKPDFIFSKYSELISIIS